MIMSKTPCRVSFVGGGSDIAAFYQRHGGAVVSTAIDKYIYIMVNEKFDHRIRLSYSRTEEVDRVEEVQHDIVREALRIFRPAGGIEITSVADIPSRGTGLGSSSSFTVGLLNSLFAFAGRHASAERLARLSSIIEIERCGHPIGKQDQYAAAFGGLNLIRFHPDGTVTVTPVICHPRTVQRLQDNLLMFYTGITRRANDILAEQSAALQETKEAGETMLRMVELAEQLNRELQSDNIDAFGDILHESWMLKRTVASGVSTSAIDGWYQAAREAGAVGGKILGAGGGGFLLLYAPRERHDAIAAALGELRRIPFAFDREGSRIVFYNPSMAAGEGVVGPMEGELPG